jgi:prepilin-type processing-associated H-X9-DG protein
VKRPITPAAVGHICPRTGRVAVLVRDYAASDLNGDAPAYWYSAKAEEWGLDPWRLVEGVDPHTHGGSLDVCFADGSCKTVGPLMTFYLSAKDAARLQAATKTD